MEGGNGLGHGHGTAGVLAVALLVVGAGSLRGQEAGLRVEGGVHLVPLVTRVSPIVAGEARTEAYVTQPSLHGRVGAWGERLGAVATVSLEPLTLERGELGAGAHGEGYVDRRHPHTYLHELMGFARVGAAADEGGWGALGASLAAGRGFVPFGTDDPMMRPFVKFPVNHHLGQILERLVAIGGVRAGPVLAEVALFGGNEPVEPTDLGRLDRFGDSWSARLTLLPVPGVELQVSRAWVVSPESPDGFGWDQRKWSAAGRFAGPLGPGTAYVLGEWKKTTEVDRGTDVFSFGSALGEVGYDWSGWRPALRVEHSERPEEERLADPFRSHWPHAAGHVLGITEWTIVALRLERGFAWRGVRAAPFVEASWSKVEETTGGLFEPEAFYGGTRITTLNIGARIGAGWHPPRMGRYGVAAPAARAHAAAHVH